ncbi:MFS transporter [Ktedonosporobacter rubrisoli]|uniref:MFS transporter n=1 Tax=Ktedonosporobacter rubrisoli TaxID=2509675 RepID=A0A4P6JS07_KTERU|nr:MFS transporter [Ktedonosporobacter rubrisoli]QBD78103.1 MFS transporter [Ktedonosporobacter rubrisoli]
MKGRAYIVYLILEGAFALFFALIATVNLVYQVEVAHLNPLQLVLVGTVLEVTSLICQIPSGILADVYSRRLAIIVGICLIGLGFVLEGAIASFETILLAQIIWGVGFTCVDGAREAWIADEVGEQNVAHAYLRGEQIGQICAMVGIIASVSIASIRLNLSIIVGGLLFIGLAVFLLLVMPEQGFRASSAREPISWQALGKTLLEGGKLVRQRTVLLIILGVAIFFGLSGEGFDRLWIDHIVTNFQLPVLGNLKPVVWFGIIQAGSMLLSIVLTEYVRRKLDMQSHATIALTLLVFNAVRIMCIVLFALAGNFVLALLAYWGASVVRQASRPIYTTWLTRNIDANVRATLLSLGGLLDSLGQIAGGPMVGLVGLLASLRAALVVTGIALVPVLPLFAWTMRKEKEPGA